MVGNGGGVVVIGLFLLWVFGGCGILVGSGQCWRGGHGGGVVVVTGLFSFFLMSLLDFFFFFWV